MPNRVPLKAYAVFALLLLGAPPRQSQAAPVVSAPVPAPAMPPPEMLSRLGINSKALETLLKRGAESHSDAIVIIKDDVVVGQWYFGKPQALIETQSDTKSVVALAIGCLLHDGKIKSLDEPVCDFYPEWRQGQKKLITIRQILNHTSGLQADHTTEELYASPDLVQLALCAELSDAPGTNNAGILQSWREGGVPAIYITRATPLVGKIFPWLELAAKLNVIFDGQENKLKYLYNHHIQQAEIVDSPSVLVAYRADGWLGQYIVIVPKEHLVAVRQISENSFNNKDTNGFVDFPQSVPAPVGETVAAQ